MTELQARYKAVCRAYIKEFCDKQDLYFEYAVLDDLGGMLCFSNEYFINFDNIRLDIDEDAPKGLILDWHEKSLKHYEKKNINYYSYLKGARYEV